MSAPWAVVQYDNRPIHAYKNLVQRNKEYCKRHGYEYVFESRDFGLPPYWVKVRLVLEILETGRYAGVLWLDTDAVVHDLSRPLDSLLVADSVFYYCGDAPPYSSPFCAAVWFIRDCNIARRMMFSWMSLYDPSSWNCVAGSWTTTGPWAGDTYEQGSFVSSMFPWYHDVIYAYPWSLLQGTAATDTSFILHFARSSICPEKHGPLVAYLKESRIIMIIRRILARCWNHHKSEHASKE